MGIVLLGRDRIALADRTPKHASDLRVNSAVVPKMMARALGRYLRRHLAKVIDTEAPISLMLRVPFQNLRKIGRNSRSMASGIIVFHCNCS